MPVRVCNGRECQLKVETYPKGMSHCPELLWKLYYACISHRCNPRLRPDCSPFLQ